MLEDPNIDAVVGAALPDVTSEMLIECQGRKACFLTKPILVSEPPRISSTTYVDYVHLASPLFHMLIKEVMRAGVGNIRSVSVVSVGNGPERSFPGVLDYGPHAVAMLFDIIFDMLECNLTSVRSTTAGKLESINAQMTFGDIQATVIAGNAVAIKETSATVEFIGGRVVRYAQYDGGAAHFEVDGRSIATDPCPNPLQVMVMEFLIDAHTKNAVPYYAAISTGGVQILTAARREAGLPRYGS